MARQLNLLVFLVFGVLLLSLVDSCSGIFESRSQFRLVRGISRPISGKLDSPVQDLERLAGIRDGEKLQEALAYETDGPLFLRFTGLQGRLWRGELSSPAYSDPGIYRLTVYQKGVHRQEQTSLITVILYPDMESYLRDLPSFIERHMGFQPWWITIAALPLAMLLLYLSYLQSGREEDILRSQGLAPIFRLARGREGWTMYFGLGARDGVTPGDALYLLDRKSRTVASFIPDEIKEDHSTVLLPLSTPVKVQHYVSRRPGKRANGGNEPS